MYHHLWITSARDGHHLKHCVQAEARERHRPKQVDLQMISASDGHRCYQTQELHQLRWIASACDGHQHTNCDGLSQCVTDTINALTDTRLRLHCRFLFGAWILRGFEICVLVLADGDRTETNKHQFRSLGNAQKTLRVNVERTNTGSA